MSNKGSDEIRYHIVEELGAYSDYKNGFRKEINLVQWNGSPVKVDCRSWNEDHTRCTRGMTFSFQELRDVVELMEKAIGFESVEN